MKAQVEKMLGIKLVVSFDSEEEDAPDEEYGHFVMYTFKPKPFKMDEDSEPPMIAIYANNKIQFWNDASPYPCAKNTQKEIKDMRQGLNPHAISIKDLTKDDYVNFIKEVKENLE